MNPRLRGEERGPRDLSQDPGVGAARQTVTQGPALGARAGRPGAGKEVAEKPGEGSRKAGLSPTEETLCLHVCDAERLSQPPVPRVLPPLPPNATASAKSEPTSQPSSSHILTVSGISLFASCLRRSALMNAEVQGHRRRATERHQAEQWSSSTTRGSPYSPKGHGYPTSFRPSRDLEVPPASLTEPGNHCCAGQEEASDDTGLHA